MIMLKREEKEKKYREEMDLVSVLMCVYNTPIEYLDKAITSILNQTYKNIELIIVDDHTEKAEIVSYLTDLNDKRIRVFRNEENIGLTKSLNKGIDLCNGKYIARMDSDDIAKKNRITEQLKYIESNGFVIMGCNWKVFPLYNTHPLCSCSSSSFKVAQIFGNQGPGHSTFFINKQRLSDLGLKYDERYRTAQDYALLCDCICKGGTIGVLRKTLVGWRKHDGQISTTNKSQQGNDVVRIRKSYLLREFNITEDEARVFVKSVHGETYRIIENYSEIEEILEKFLKKNDEDIVRKEIHKYWFIQGLKRFKYTHQTDFIRSRLFFECLRLDRFGYIMINSIKERIHYFWQPFVKI